MTSTAKAGARRGAAAVLATVALASGCASPGAPDTRRVLLGDLTTTLVVPLYADFERGAEALERSANELCQGPDQARLEAAQTAWWDARTPWKRAEVFAFGPYSRPGYRIGPRIDTWPVDAPRVRELLDSGDPLDPARLADAATTQRGLPVIELLLHGDGGTPLGPTDLSGRRCEYLEAATADLVANARALHQAWAPEGDDFSRELSDAGRTGTAFRSLRHAFGEVVNRIVYTLENARRDRFGRPLGEQTGSPQPELAESRPSGRSVQDLRDALQGIEWLYFGREPEAELGAFDGLSLYARERGAALDDVVRSQLDEARRSLDAIEMPLADAVVTRPALVSAASERYATLQTTFEVDVIGAMGLSVGFNDNDGD